MLEVELNVRHRQLLVAADVDYRGVVVGHGIVDALGLALGTRNVAEHGLDLALHLVHVDIANYDDALQVGVVPRVVVVAQILIGEVVDDVDAANGHAVGILGVGIHGALCVGVDAHQSAVARTPLFVYHAALLVDLTVLEQDEVAPVVENQQAGVEDVLVVAGHVADVVDGLVDAGVGVEVGAVLDGLALAPVHDALAALVAREVLGAVECHVLEEVSQSALTRLLEYGAHLLRDVEFHTVLGLVVVADVVGEAIVEMADAHGGVDWDVGQLLCGDAHGAT